MDGSTRSEAITGGEVMVGRKVIPGRPQPSEGQAMVVLFHVWSSDSSSTRVAQGDE